MAWTVKKGLRSLAKTNANIITFFTCVFIIVEGSVIWFYPSQWWKPLGVMFAIMGALLAWRNMKSVVKFVISLTMSMTMAALAVTSGYSLTNTSIGGSAWGLSIMLIWSLTVAVSYFVISTNSRWICSLMATAIGFMVSYAFMPAGMMAIVLSGVLSGMLSGVLLLKSDAVPRITGRTIRVSKEWEPKESYVKAMQSLWPSMKHVKVPMMGKHRWAVLWYGEGVPTIMTIPIDLQEPFEPTARHGVTYRRRDVRKSLNWFVLSVMTKSCGLSTIPVLVDVNGENKDSEEWRDGGILSSGMVDSVSKASVGVMLATGGKQDIRKRTVSIVGKFGNGVKGDAKHVSTVDRKYAKLDINKTASDSSGANGTGDGHNDDKTVNGSDKNDSKEKTDA